MNDSGATLDDDPLPKTPTRWISDGTYSRWRYARTRPCDVAPLRRRGHPRWRPRFAVVQPLPDGRIPDGRLRRTTGVRRRLPLRGGRTDQRLARRDPVRSARRPRRIQARRRDRLRYPRRWNDREVGVPEGYFNRLYASPRVFGAGIDLGADNERTNAGSNPAGLRDSVAAGDPQTILLGDSSRTRCPSPEATNTRTSLGGRGRHRRLRERIRRHRRERRRTRLPGSRRGDAVRRRYRRRHHERTAPRRRDSNPVAVTLESRVGTETVTVSSRGSVVTVSVLGK